MSLQWGCASVLWSTEVRKTPWLWLQWALDQTTTSYQGHAVPHTSRAFTGWEHVLPPGSSVASAIVDSDWDWPSLKTWKTKTLPVLNAIRAAKQGACPFGCQPDICWLYAEIGCGQLNLKGKGNAGSAWQKINDGEEVGGSQGVLRNLLRFTWTAGSFM